jgi:hypothetical protein
MIGEGVARPEGDILAFSFWHGICFSGHPLFFVILTGSRARAREPVNTELSTLKKTPF